MDYQLADKISVPVKGDWAVSVIPDKQHEFLISTKDVAFGYGVYEEVILNYKESKINEIIEGIHFIISDSGIKSTTILWTRLGVLQLEKYIENEPPQRSSSSKIFKLWADVSIVQAVASNISLRKVPQSTHQCLTEKRIIDIMKDIAMIDDKNLRISIINKLLAE